MKMEITLNNNKSYQKYKLIVKKWEKDFMQKNGRVPSKHDIKEAPSHVRLAYKHYFNLKSEILEHSLMDIPLDDDLSPVDGFDINTNQELNSESSCKLNEGGDFPKLPTNDEIEKMMTKIFDTSNEQIDNFNASSDKQQISDKVWGKHLNNKRVDNKLRRKKNTPRKNFSLSSEMFTSCSFNKRNPRKSLSSKPLILPDSEPNVSHNSISTVSSDKTETSVKVVKQTEHIFTSVNSVQAVLTSASSSLRQIDMGWLNRCSGGFPTEGTSAAIESANKNMPNVSSDNVSSEFTSSVSSYGLKNLQVYPKLPIPDEELCHSDFVENSESEAEHVLNKSSYRRIRPIVKKCKLDSSSPKEVNSKSLDSSVAAVSEKNDDANSNNENMFPTKVKRVPRKAKSRPKHNKQSKSTETTKVGVKRRSKPKHKNVLTSESECDEPVIQKKPVTRSKRGKNVKILHKDKELNKSPQDVEYESEFLGEHISHPRFPINSSILKESNLVEGLTVALELPKSVQKAGLSRSTRQDLSEEDKLQKKIDEGRLNENFVRINLEKKIYVRGKKTMNFSKFKKQQWKNKKKMLHSTPEFPEGGVLKCFKCNQPGHMARYCKAGRGASLLALEDVEDKSPHISIGDAQVLSNKVDQPKVVDTLLYECIEKTELNHQAAPITSESFNLKGIQPISQSFIKLLATPTTSTSTQKFVEPLYQLSSAGSLIDTPDEVKSALNLFGHASFKSGQETAVMRILSGLSTLVTLSTGSGKSLCYQLPAYLYAKHNKCITIVISPLVSLMEDQVTSMPSFVNAACLHTNQSPTQREKIVELIKNGDVHILLVSPEAIVAGERSTGFGAILRQLPPIAFACIDEVHCVSQWSHNFRPSYLMICRVLREKLGVKCVLGLTATATKPTMSEIVQHLEICDGVESVITNKPLPENLILSVSRDNQRDHYLLELLESERFSQCYSIIVYCIRRDECERIASLLRSSMQGSKPVVHEGCNTGSKKRKRFSWIVEPYHAGMSAAKRQRVQKAFMKGELRIVVATVAFGMGINKSDIRGVIHYNMPSSFESYVQEVGRAGRDGLAAQCHVFIDREFKDKDELLRHIHANSIERHVIRKLLQKIFQSCGCSKLIKSIEETEPKKCQGHEVAFSVDETVAELDAPPENIATLLCYLELHPKKYAKVLTNVYIMCKVISYGGLDVIFKAAEKCPPLAMAIALHKKAGMDLENTGNFEFCVIEVAAAIGWESGIVKYHLKNLEWEKKNGYPKKSLLRVEFNTLGFRVKAPGDLTPSELDAALDSLYERTQLQEKAMLYQLQEVSKALSSVSHPSIFQCSTLDSEDGNKEQSNKLKEIIRSYFSKEKPLQDDVELDDRPINVDQVTSDVRSLLGTYRDCTFTGRAVARILQGISSPNFPAIVWGRCRYWRSHLTEDFYKLVNIAKQQIISLR